MKNVIFVLAAVCLISQAVFCAEPANDVWRFQAGIRNSSDKGKLKSSEIERLLESLRQKTGFDQMRFDEAGFLILGDRSRFTGGSEAARKLLAAAVDSQQAFDLKANNNSPAVAFACLSAGHIRASFQTKAQIKIRELYLDFADFAELRGDRRTLAAFDPGLAMLHELAHGVLGLQDAVGEVAELGECDAVINQIRRELGLPERLAYSARVHWSPNGAGSTGLAELAFTLDRVKNDRLETKRLYLHWEAKRVAHTSSHHTAATRPALMAVVR